MTSKKELMDTTTAVKLVTKMDNEDTTRVVRVTEIIFQQHPSYLIETAFTCSCRPECKHTFKTSIFLIRRDSPIHRAKFIGNLYRRYIADYALITIDEHTIWFGEDYGLGTAMKYKY